MPLLRLFCLLIVAVMASCVSGSRTAITSNHEMIEEAIDSIVVSDMKEIDSSVSIYDFEGRIEINKVDYDTDRMDSTTMKPVIKSETKVVIDLSKKDSVKTDIKREESKIKDSSIVINKDVKTDETNTDKVEESSVPKYLFYSLITVLAIIIVLFVWNILKKANFAKK